MKFQEQFRFVSFLTCLGYVLSLAAPATDAQWNEILDKCADLADAVAFQQTPIGLNEDCRAFSRCPNPFYSRPIVTYCPPGSLFDPDSSTIYCNFAHRINCSATGRLDPCSGEPNGFRPDTLRSEQNRGAILQCFRGRTVGGVQCPACEQYGNSETGCVAIPNCIAVDVAPEECHHEANPADERTYYTIGPGTKTLMHCADGTVYRQAECNCVFPEVN